MKIKTINRSTLRHFILLIAILAYIFLSDSCANQGVGPGGGPRDSIPPVIVNSTPLPFETNYSKKEIQLTFNEYVVADNLNGKLVVSPPLAEKTSIRTKGKSIIVKINEDLIPNRTYSVDFKDGIKDYNEGNKIESLRILFSTYDQIDTLRIGGYLLDAFTLEPVENSMASLYSFNDDSLFNSLVPDFIAKTNDEGYFLFDNLPKGNFKLYGLVDGDNNLFFSQETEQIAFTDSMIFPTAEYISEIDTLFENNDTIISKGYTEFKPGPVYGLLFLEDYFAQYLDYFKRETEDRILITFSESLTDSFNLELIDVEQKEWSYIEYSKNRDSVNIWITDTLVSGIDSLYLKIDYTVIDTSSNFTTKTDTLDFLFSPKEEKSKKKEKEEKDELPTLFEFNTNLTTNNFDLNLPITITSPLPVENIVDSLIHLEIAVTDSTFEKVKFKLEKVPDSKRKFIVEYAPKEEAKYRFSIDSASVFSLSGITNDLYETTFKTQKTDYYGTAIFVLNGINSNGILQILKNSKTEEVVKEIGVTEEDKTVTIAFLKPGKFKVKIISDLNNNGKWDTGNINKKIQPEPVFYFPKIINIKSNWELKENWDIVPNSIQIKELEDEIKKEED